MATTLKCAQCGHENEAERIYCHNCGAKLDRSLLPETETKREAPEKTVKRVKKMTNPRTGFFVGFGSSLTKALLWAVAVAAVIEIARPPVGTPKPVDKDQTLDAQALLMAIDQTQSKPVSSRFAIDEPTINKYLQGTIKEQATGLIGDEVKFKRVFVRCLKDEKDKPGVCWIWTEQSLFDYSVYAGVGYELSIANNQVATKCAGGYFGRLPIHPAIMKYGDIIFSKIWDALKREHKTMNEMKSIEVDKGQIIVVTKGA